jgi:hypothetical protein
LGIRTLLGLSISHLVALFLRIAETIFREVSCNYSAERTAMAMAMIYPEPDRGGARKNGEKSEAAYVAKAAGVSEKALSQGRTILRMVPETAKLVLAEG